MRPETKVCGCGKGYRSAYDGKCGHCRTPREQRAHVWKRCHEPDPDHAREDRDERRRMEAEYGEP